MPKLSDQNTQWLSAEEWTKAWDKFNVVKPQESTPPPTGVPGPVSQQMKPKAPKIPKIHTNTELQMKVNAAKMQAAKKQMESAAISTAQIWKAAESLAGAPQMPMPSDFEEAGLTPPPVPGFVKKAAKAPMRHIELLQVGADVEEFLYDPIKRIPTPVIGLIGGTKEAPMPVLESVDKGFALQEDNVALEYNIPPAGSVGAFVSNLMEIRKEIQQRVHALGLAPAITASMAFTEDQLRHPQAQRFGCEPDFNVWERKINEPPSASEASKTLRTAGGHIHVSFTVDGKPVNEDDHQIEMELVVMALDLYLGVPFALLDPDTKRSQMYGRAGAFRPKPYGIEYRVLSNYWTTTPELMMYTFSQIETAIYKLNALSFCRADFMQIQNAVECAINQKSKDHIAYLTKLYNLKYPTEELLIQAKAPLTKNKLGI